SCEPPVAIAPSDDSSTPEKFSSNVASVTWSSGLFALQNAAIFLIAASPRLVHAACWVLPRAAKRVLLAATPPQLAGGFFFFLASALSTSASSLASSASVLPVTLRVS